MYIHYAFQMFEALIVVHKGDKSGTRWLYMCSEIVE